MTRRQPTKKKPVIILLLILLGIAVVVTSALLWRNTRSVNTETTSTKHFSGPTQQEKDEAADHKDELVKQMNEENQGGDENNGGQKAVTPIITDASQNGSDIRISGYISGIFEDGGTCTATITQGAAKIVKTSKAFANVSTTQCAPITIDRSEFPAAGQWQVTLAYNSASAKGASQAQALAIQ